MVNNKKYGLKIVIGFFDLKIEEERLWSQIFFFRDHNLIFFLLSEKQDKLVNLGVLFKVVIYFEYNKMEEEY